MNLKKEFISQLESSYPRLQNQPLSLIVSENLISTFNIELPKDILTQAQNIIASAFAMREHPSYLQHYAEEIKALGLEDPKNKAIVMSYDFHIDESGSLKLIEINTNASFLLLGYEMYKMKNLALPVADFSTEEIRTMIMQELELQGKEPKIPHITIVDESPADQKLYIEFLAYNELFRQFGWKSEILDYQDVFRNGLPDFIYNRYTDFLLQADSSQEIRARYLDRSVCLSPNPFEYLLLADKQRMIDWSVPGFFEKMGLSSDQIAILRRMLPEAYDLNSENKEKIWAQRKKFFFKPKRAFGSKQSFKGASISRKYFEEFSGADIIAQEFIAAPERIFETSDGPQSFKYDLRCYAYQGRLQLVVARLYQGQVTNLRTTGGGFTAVIFK